MKRRICIVASCLLLVYLRPAASFELATHAALTDTTVALLLSEKTRLVDQLGLRTADIDLVRNGTLSGRFFDIAPSLASQPQRESNVFERDIMSRVDAQLYPGRQLEPL